MVSVTMREMLEAGVHFGHQVRKWNPKMKPFIYGKKNGIYIINLQTSIELFKKALGFITEVVADGKEALIVGTKKQAQAIITEVSEEMGMHYVNKRWLGGLLTNFPIVKKSIEKLLELDEMKRDGRWDVKSKKEQSKLEKIYKKLHKNLWGVRNITDLPGVLIVIDSTFESNAVYEARKLNIPIVAIVDTNADPEEITYPVPGNDDAIRSIKLFTHKFGEAVKVGMEQRISQSLEEQKATEGEVTEEGQEAIAEEVVEKETEQVTETEAPPETADTVEKPETPVETQQATEAKAEEPEAEKKEAAAGEEVKEEPPAESSEPSEKKKEVAAKEEEPEAAKEEKKVKSPKTTTPKTEKKETKKDEAKAKKPEAKKAAAKDEDKAKITEDKPAQEKKTKSEDKAEATKKKES